MVNMLKYQRLILSQKVFWVRRLH